MMRVSNSSIGADWYWSSPFPCGMPSTTSTITTRRANSFSAIRCAVVAPTFPAPTTVILLTMTLDFRVKWSSRQKLSGRNPPGNGPCTARVARRRLCSALPADLREGAQTAHLHLQQLVRLRLRRERGTEEGLERLAAAQRPAEVDLVVAEKARAQPPVRR